MRTKHLCTIIVSAVALLVGSAQALDVNGYLLVDPSITETGINVGVSSAGHLDVAAGATLNVTTDMLRIGAGASGQLTTGANATINADGNYYWPSQFEHGSFSIGADGDAIASFGAGTTINSKGEIYIGYDYRWDPAHSAAADVTFGAGSTINIDQTVGWALKIGANEAVGREVRVRMTDTTLNGVLFHTGGTLEVEGTVQANSDSARFRTSGALGTYIKPIGEGSKLVNNIGGFQLMGLQVDVSEYSVPQGNTWYSILEGTPGTDWLAIYRDISFAAGTDPNWLIQTVGDDGIENRRVEVMYAGDINPPYIMGDSSLDGYVDDADLSLLLANWHNTTDWGHGNLSDDDPFGGTLGFVDDADLSLLLANWHAGTPPPMAGGSVPEPATMLMLAIGAAGALIRRKH